MEHVKHLIIGAGPTGLGAAWRLDALGATDWLLCERTPVEGGLAGSVVDQHGFTWDMGGHVQFSHYQYFDDLMDELLGVDGWLYHDRESWVWMRERFVPYPFQLNLHRLPPEERWSCLQGLLHATRRAATEGASPPAHFGDWIDRTFGAGIADVFLRPYNFKVWAYPPEQMNATWIGDRVAVVDLERVLRNVALGRDDVSWGPNNQFRFPARGGTGAIWQALGRRLRGRHPQRMRLGVSLTALDTTRRVARFSDGSEVGYEQVLSTIPLDALVAMTDRSAELTPSLAGLRYSSTHVLGVGLTGQPPASLRGKCWMYFPEDDCPFYRVTVFSHYSPNNVPDATRQWSLMAEVAESPEKPVDASRIVEDTVQGMLATGLVEDRSHVHHVWHRRLEHGYPTPSLGRDAALEAVLPALSLQGVFSRGRFGAWTYEVSNQDHSFAQGVETVDHWLHGAEEETLLRPAVVNARRSAPRRRRKVG